MSLALTLKRAREAQENLEQKKLAAAIGVAQGTVSAWENGTQKPTRKHLVPLANALNLKLEVLEDLWRPGTAAPTRSRRSATLSARDYLREQQTYLLALGDKLAEVRVCFLGPESLPVLDSVEVQDMWIENLFRGANYCILWFLCLTAKGALRRLAPCLKRIGEAVKSRVDEAAKSNKSQHAGKIIHYGLRVIANDEDARIFNENLAEFNECRDARLTGNDFRSMASGLVLKEDLQRRLLRHHTADGSLVIYHHTIIGSPPLASLSLRATRDSPEGEEHPMFCFLGKSTCEVLRDLMKDFFQEVEARLGAREETL